VTAGIDREVILGGQIRQRTARARSGILAFRSVSHDHHVECFALRSAGMLPIHSGRAG